MKKSTLIASKACLFACLSSLLGLVFPVASVRASDTNWLSGTGSWTNPARWLGAMVPSYGSNINIDKNPAFDSLVLLTGTSPIIGSLRIDAGDTLWLQDSHGLSLTVGVVKGIAGISYGGLLSNSGSLQLGSGVGPAKLKIAGQVVLTGSGTVNLYNSAIDSGSSPSGDRLLNLNNTIRGSGILNASGSLGITNNGLIQNGSNQTMSVVVSATDNGFVNRGTLLATGGTMNLSCYAPASLINTSGVLMVSNTGTLNIGPNLTVLNGKITAKGSSLLNIQNSTVRYATISAQNSFFNLSGTAQDSSVSLDNTNFVLAPGANTLTNVSFSGIRGSQVIFSGGATQLNNTAFRGTPVSAIGAVYVTGPMVSTSEFTLGNVAGGSSLYFSGVVNLSGSGSLFLPGLGNSIQSDNRLGAPAVSSFTNINETVHGGGVINPTVSLKVTNRALIQTDPGMEFTILTGSCGPLVNSGTIQASDNGLLNFPAIVSGTINNAGGRIQVMNGSGLIIGSGMTVNSGILSASGSSFLAADSVNINSARIVMDRSPLTLSGTLLSTPVTLTSSTLTVTGNGPSVLKSLSITGGPTSLVNLISFTDVNNVAFLGGVPVTIPTAVSIAGYLTNTGGFRLGANSSAAINGVATLTGSSEFVLGLGSVVQSDPRSPATGALLINANNLIHGTGILNPTGSLAIQNRSVIQSGSGDSITFISGSAGALRNLGIIEAIDTGLVTLEGVGSDVSNLGGTIRALNHSQIQITPGTTVTGGTLAAKLGSVLNAPATTIKGTSILIDASLLNLSGTLQNTPLRTVSGTLLLHDTTLNNLTVTNSGHSEVNGTNLELNTISLLGAPSVTLNGANYQTGRMVNTSSIDLNGSLSFAGGVTFSGTGALLLNSAALDVDFRTDTDAVSTFTNYTNRIRGSGMINPSGHLTFVNRSIVETGPGMGLTLYTGSSSVLVNSGTLRAINSGMLVLSPLGSGTIANTGGLLLTSGSGSSLLLGPGLLINGGRLRAENLGTLQSNGATIQNASMTVDHSQAQLSGTVQNTPIALISSTLTLGSGAGALKYSAISGGSTSLVLLAAVPTELTNVSFLGRVPVIATTPTYVTGILVNTGSFALNAPLRASGMMTLSGTGDFLLSSDIVGDTRAGAPAQNGFLNLNNLVHGIGTINFNGDIAVTNRSQIQAGMGEYLTIYGGTRASLINSGTIRAINSGQITLYSGTLNNAAGLLQSSGSDSSIGILGMDIFGGRFTADNGAFLGIGYSNLNNATLNVSRSTLFLGYNALVQNTPIMLDRSIAELDANLTLRNLAISSTGSSIVEIGYSGFTRFENVRILNNTPVITVGSGNQIQVSGGLVNTGTMLLGSASNTAHVIISGSVRLSGSGTVILGGSTTVSGSGTLVNVDHMIRGTGIIGGGIDFINAATVLANPGDSLTFQSGSDGAMQVRNEKLFSIQNSGSQTSLMTVDGNFTQTAAAALSFRIGGVLTSGSVWVLNYNTLAISGTASLAGTFKLAFDPGVVVNAGAVLTIMTYGTEIGHFTQFTGLDLSNGVTLVPAYNANSFTLTAEAPIIVATPPGAAPAAARGIIIDGGAGPTSVPEPSTGALVLLAGALLAQRKARRSRQ